MSKPRAQAAAVRLLLVVLFAAGLFVHFDLRRRLTDFVDADEAVVGLMARHIAAGKSHPAFYYGQPYLGSLEAWLGAASGLGQPPTTASLRLMLVLVWSLLAISTAGLVRAMGGSRVAAALALGLVSLVPPEVLLWHLRFRGGFLLAAALLAAALWAGARSLAEPTRQKLTVLFGALAGLAFWTNQLTAPALMVFAIALMVRTRRVAALIAAFAVGSAPFWVYNVLQPFATFKYLAAHAVANVPRFAEHTHTLVTVTLPWLFGGVGLSAWTGMSALRFAGLMLVVAGLLLSGLSRVRPVVTALRARQMPETADLLLLALLVSLPARRNAELNQLLHWTPLVAALLVVLPARAGRRALLCFPVGLLCLWTVELALMLPGFAASGHEPRMLVKHLERHGVRSIRAEHRPSYLVAWFSKERIAASPALSYGYYVDRYPPYTAQVQADPQAVWVAEAGSPSEKRFSEVLRAHGIRARPASVSIYHVYLPVSIQPHLLSASAARGAARSGVPEQPIALRVLLTGDAGNPWTPDAKRLLDELRRDASDPRAAERVVVWLGDNLYGSGLPAPEEADPKRPALEPLLSQQIDLVRGTGAQFVMVPGNHDWDHSGRRGWSRVLAEGAYVEQYGAGFARYLPAAACPGPAEVDLAGRLRIVAIDSEWFLRPPIDPERGTPWKPDPASGACAVAGFNSGDGDPLSALARLLAEGRDQDLLIIAHHPVRTHGPHGTRGGAAPGSLLPCLSQQDLCGEGYRRYATDLERVMATSERAGRRGLLLMAAGHDHALQVLTGSQGVGPDRFLVSGTASDPTRVEVATDTVYASARHGYLRLDWLASGERWLSVVEADAEGHPSLAFEERLVPGSD